MTSFIEKWIWAELVFYCWSCASKTVKVGPRLSVMILSPIEFYFFGSNLSLLLPSDSSLMDYNSCGCNLLDSKSSITILNFGCWDFSWTIGLMSRWIPSWFSVSLDFSAFFSSSYSISSSAISSRTDCF